MTQVSRSYLKVLKCSTAQLHNLYGNTGSCAGAGDLLTMGATGGDKVCFLQIITCCSRKVAFLN